VAAMGAEGKEEEVTEEATAQHLEAVKANNN
jgi:hypothetical protein